MANSKQSQQPIAPGTSASRRSFVAALAGAVAILTPLAAGVTSFLSPLFRKSQSPTVRVALLSQVPDDGMPHFFSVVADRQDAWNRYLQQRIGAVYLVRQPGRLVPTAFTAKCPHAGCYVGYTPGDEQFVCPCHTSTFNFDGTRSRGDEEVAPRDMDTLEVELRELAGIEGQQATEVLVKFVDYQTGRKDQKPSA